MKMNKIIKSFAVLALAAAFTACNDAKYAPLGSEGGEPVVYFNEATSSRGGSMAMLGEALTQNLTVRLSGATDHDVTVTLGVDESLLADYNNRMSTAYEVLPEEYYSLETETVVIPKGSVAAPSVALTIMPFKTEGGISYALPVKIASCTGAKIADRPSNYVVEFVTEIGEQPAAEFQNYRCATQLDPQTDWNLELYEYTLEWWVNQPLFNINNQAIINSGSNDKSTNLYIRFGDVNHSGANRYAYLQIKTMGSDQGLESPAPETNPLQTNTWYHFAIVYKSSDGTSTLYMNGEQVSQATAAAGTPMDMDKVQICHIGQGEEMYRPNNTRMCQLRLWKTARTQQELKQYMYIEPRYNDPNLEFYLPMNEGNNDEGIFHDVTGNGHNGTFGNMRASQYPSAPMKWTTVNLSSNQ